MTVTIYGIKNCDTMKKARAWLDTHLPPAWRRDHCYSRVEDPIWIEVARDWQRMLFDGGWAAISWPPAQSYVDLIGPAILRHGTEAQRRRYLAPMMSAELPGCFAMTETGHGSNVRGIETTATYYHKTRTFVINSNPLQFMTRL